MKNYLFIFLAILLIRCNFEKSLEGEYKSVDNNSILKSIIFDDSVAAFKGGIMSLMPSMKYEIKSDKVYIENAEGILIFKIIDSKTIEGDNSLFKGDRFKKK